MSYFTEDSDRALTTQSEEIRVLGQTGQTVVYMFPDGRAFAEREQPDFDALGKQDSSSEDSELQVLEDLIDAGKMTQAQKAVVLHDKEMTGMSVEEILIARRWL